MGGDSSSWPRKLSLYLLSSGVGIERPERKIFARGRLGCFNHFAARPHRENVDCETKDPINARKTLGSDAAKTCGAVPLALNGSFRNA
jgi:hypothetical protein